MLIRCTQKLLKASNIKPEDVEIGLEGLLGEWYANAVALPSRGRSVVMFTSATTLLTVVAPGRVLTTTLPVFRRRLPLLLEQLFLPPEWIARQMSALGEVHVAKTSDRRVLGQMTEFADRIQSDAHYAEEYGEDLDWNVLEIGLAGVLTKGAQGYENAERRLRGLVSDEIAGR